eukprot:TRINITY_DN2207_c3_g1_i4.p1 TRINITY_DN2207_c3_g1~~TRINITY_DN2207_c3_g1_i4.p1  ORF type:complete len:713 (-),score=130.31 TRINITY_DN2207_c3_g1_i4:474-2612(-)
MHFAHFTPPFALPLPPPPIPRHSGVGLPLQQFAQQPIIANPFLSSLPPAAHPFITPPPGIRMPLTQGPTVHPPLAPTGGLMSGAGLGSYLQAQHQPPQHTLRATPTTNSGPDQSILDLIVRKHLGVKKCSNLEQFCTILEEGYWDYKDLYSDADPLTYPPLSFKQFLEALYDHPRSLQPPFSNFRSPPHEMAAWYTKFKQSMPSYGAILLSPSFDMCVMVRSIGGKQWGFPRGKPKFIESALAKDGLTSQHGALELEKESPLECTIREIFEELGVHIRDRVREEDCLEIVTGKRKMLLFVVPYVALSTSFAPQLRQEIAEIKWLPIASLRAKLYGNAYDQLAQWIGNHRPTPEQLLMLDQIQAEDRAQYLAGSTEDNPLKRTRDDFGEDAGDVEAPIPAPPQPTAAGVMSTEDLLNTLLGPVAENLQQPQLLQPSQSQPQTQVPQTQEPADLQINQFFMEHVQNLLAHLSAPTLTEQLPSQTQPPQSSYLPQNQQQPQAQLQPPPQLNALYRSNPKQEAQEPQPKRARQWDPLDPLAGVFKTRDEVLTSQPVPLYSFPPATSPGVLQASELIQKWVSSPSHQHPPPLSQRKPQQLPLSSQQGYTPPLLNNTSSTTTASTSSHAPSPPHRRPVFPSPGDSVSSIPPIPARTSFPYNNYNNSNNTTTAGWQTLRQPQQGGPLPPVTQKPFRPSPGSRPLLPNTRYHHSGMRRQT